MPQAAPADPVADALKRANTTDAVRASAWDAFHNSASADDLAKFLKVMPLPDDVKADLWDLKQHSSAAAPAVARSPLAGALEGATSIGPAPRSAMDSIADFGSQLQSLNPKALISGLNTSFYHPIETVKAIGQAQGHVFDKGVAAIKRGDYGEGVGHLVNWLIPFFGPQLDEAGDSLREGRVAEGLGKTADVALQTVAPEALRRIPEVRVPALAPNANPVEASAVAFGNRNKIPMDAATATGNRAVASIQHVADRSLGGSLVAAPAKAEQAARLATVGEQLAAKGYPASAVAPEQAGQGVRDLLEARAARDAAARTSAGDRLAARVSPNPVTPEQAGQGVVDSITQTIHDLHADASTAYDKLRTIEADPANLRTIHPDVAPPREGARAMFVTKGGAKPDEIFLAAWKDAKESGFKGSIGELKLAFDEKVQEAKALKEATESRGPGGGEEYGHAELLKSIRELGGLKPFEMDYQVGAPAQKMTGEFDNLKQAFGNQKGANSIFRNDGLAADDMAGQLKQDPRWDAILSGDGEELKSMLEDIASARMHGKKPGSTGGDLQHYLRGTGMEPGVKWWEPVGQPVDMPLPVDLRAAKEALRPVYDQLNRQYSVTQKEASKGFTALGNIVNGPDHAPLSQVDMDLGAIKTIARGADMPELRSMSQGLAANAVKKLDAAVRATALQAGPEALKALEAGRSATVGKYGAASVLETLRDEPVQVFNSATWANDAGVSKLRDVAKLAPAELPKIGRAYLDGLLGQDPAVASRTWAKLGPETRKLLFADPKVAAAVDAFVKPGHGGSAAAILKQMPLEPVQTFNQSVWAKDAGIARLRAIARLAPAEMPKIARAYLDDMLHKATSEGSFDKARTLYTQWENLGPKTKELLFKDPAYVQDLNDFFKLAKMTGENSNPSGTGHTLINYGQLGWIFTDPLSGISAQIGLAGLSNLLHSPRGVRALTQGFKVNVADRAAAVAATNALTRAAGGSLDLVPLAADGTQPATGSRK